MSLLKDSQKYTRRRKLEAVSQFDGHAHIRNVLRDMAAERGDYSGCPIPLEGQRLVIEPTFKYASLSEIGKEDEPPESTTFKVRNMFWSARLRTRVAICEDPPGKFWAAPLTGSSSQGAAILHTLGACDVWGIEQESNALELLGTMLRHRQFKQYLLTGSFIESSEKSAVKYVFRKLRPTIAFRCDDKGSRILCTLCMHPIGYYEES